MRHKYHCPAQRINERDLFSSHTMRSSNVENNVQYFHPSCKVTCIGDEPLKEDF